PQLMKNIEPPLCLVANPHSQGKSVGEPVAGQPEWRRRDELGPAARWRYRGGWIGGDGGMRRIMASLALAALLAQLPVAPAGAQERAAGDYPLTADSLVEPGVAQGRL